ncbi:MAG TPA: CdaR family protein [Candidatus Angelobacter sp.]|nr:CdaR family protein [Candidatus Angelobacter sp.]
MRFLLRNWHLKLSAVLLATVLYTGLVFSGSFSESQVQLTIGISGQPADTAVISGTPGAVDVTYRAPNDVTGTLTGDSFRATVDLSDYDMERSPEPQVLPVQVVSLVEGVEVVHREPATVTVEIDRLVTRVVPVTVDYGQVPESLEIGEPVTSVDEVEVRGASTLVDRVDRAVGRVLIDESGIRVERTVTLEPVDIDGQPVANVAVDPETITVEIDVQAVETNRTIAVRPQITGTPSPGFALASLSVEPSTVTIRGLPDVLTEIEEILTASVDIGGLSADEEFEIDLIIPDGARLLEPEEARGTVTVLIEPSVSSRTFVVGVVCDGAGDNACLPGLEQISVTVSGPGSAFAQLSAANLTPILDVSGLDPGSYQITPSIGGLPAGVSLEAISPGSVPVTLVAPAPPPEPTESPEP